MALGASSPRRIGSFPHSKTQASHTSVERSSFISPPQCVLPHTLHCFMSSAGPGCCILCNHSRLGCRWPLSHSRDTRCSIFFIKIRERLLLLLLSRSRRKHGSFVLFRVAHVGATPSNAAPHPRIALLRLILVDGVWPSQSFVATAWT